MTDVIDRLANSDHEDNDINVWAVRAAGIVSALVMNPERYDKDQIIEFLTQLLEFTPTNLIAAVAIAGAAMSGQEVPKF